MPVLHCVDGCRSAACVLSSGPLSAQKAAADVLSMATNMVRLQTQMSALSESVEQMQLEWSNTAAAFKAESEAMRSVPGQQATCPTEQQQLNGFISRLTDCLKYTLHSWCSPTVGARC